ncbi:glycosyltransferase family 2 protein [Aeromonas enteropelogenes]|uniref:glycosyltransferase family 2 protein n=1 Tax=Aeromonas enteropelogenes TaxID=29489 RepID=UPI003BA0683A
MSKYRVTISVVIYNVDLDLLQRTLSNLLCAFKSNAWDIELYLRDNSLIITNSLSTLLETYSKAIAITFFHDGNNIGYGEGHNKCLSPGDYHLILNPDLEVAPDALQKALEFMEKHPECGLLTPHATWDDGQVQRLCKRYPTVFDLLLRGGAPAFVKRIFQKRLDHYEMADLLNEWDILWDPPIVSGCFMLFRTEVLHKLGGFDPRFFLYFEDFDLSLRAGKISRIAYVPQVKVVHHGGHASRKGWRHIWMFGRSMVTFFNIHGWRWW